MIQQEQHEKVRGKERENERGCAVMITTRSGKDRLRTLKILQEMVKHEGLNVKRIAVCIGIEDPLYDDTPEELCDRLSAARVRYEVIHYGR